MAAKKNHKVLLKKLKKQVGVLQRKETQTRNKLRAALKKIRKLGHSYENRLATKMQAMKDKLADTQASTYAKVAMDIERQLKKSVEAKASMLKSMVDKLEKKFISKLSKGLVRRNKKVAKTKKAAR